jgi:hypothetical protein
MTTLAIRIELCNPTEARLHRSPSYSSTESDAESDNPTVPITRSPLDSCRGSGHPKKRGSKVRDAATPSHKKSAKH